MLWQDLKRKEEYVAELLVSLQTESGAVKVSKFWCHTAVMFTIMCSSNLDQRQQTCTTDGICVTMLVSFPSFFVHDITQLDMPKIALFRSLSLYLSLSFCPSVSLSVSLSLSLSHYVSLHTFDAFSTLLVMS